MKILSTAFYRESVWTLPDWAVDELRGLFPDARIVKLTSTDRILTEIADTDFLLAAFINESQVQAARRLKWIHSPSAGLDGLLIPAVVHGDIVVSNSRGVHAIPMA